MTQQEELDLRNYCAFLMKQYGFYFSPHDPVIPALYIIHKEMQLNIQNNTILSAQVKAASTRMNSKVFHFNGDDQAWGYQMGITFRWVLIALLLLLGALLGFWHWSKTNDVRKAQRILESTPHLDVLLHTIQQEKSGSFFIDFTLAKGDSIQPGKEFIKVDARTVRVYLGESAIPSKPNPPTISKP